MERSVTAAALADRCVNAAMQHLEDMITAHAPSLRLPRIFAGHLIGADVRADLCFTLGLLSDYGVEEVAGHEVRDALHALLAGVDGRRTHTFFSYRVAETALRLGHRAPLPENIAEAADSSAALAALDDGTLPRNYAAVLARCEVARSRLGLIPSQDPVMADLLERTRDLLASNPLGYLDDSRSGIGRFDIYTADIYLFTEPFADALGDVWRRGAASAVDLVERTAATNGSAFGWGRSTGALGVALTVELAGLVARHHLDRDLGAWLARASVALDQLDRWFGADGVIRAHQYRSTFGYRGPFRRLQMTLDCLGKLADAALSLRNGGGAAVGAMSDAFPARDELVVLDPGGTASVWSYRSSAAAFTVPLVGATVSDYLPALRNPGLFETPVDSGLVVGAPFAIRSGRTYAPALPPCAVEHRPGELVVEHGPFHLTGQLERPAGDSVLHGARRRARYRVDGRTIHVEEALWFSDKLPHAVGLQVAEAAGRPLRVELTRVSGEAAVTTIDTSGIKEWRSFWGELPVVHQVDLEPAAEIELHWSVTPKLRVLATAHDHHYHRALYDPIQHAVVDSRFPVGRMNDIPALRAALERCDIFHLHWPEWLFGADLDRNRLLVEELRRASVRIVWTQHNFAPHAGDAEELRPVYELWAGAADGILHHSEWGRAQVHGRYSYRPDAVEAVVAHPHFGHLGERSREARAQVERALSLDPAKLRLGVVGAPRPGKDVEMVMRAVHRSHRDDIELVVFSLSGKEAVPVDDRIRAVPYEMVPRSTYEARLSAVDVLVLPFDPATMLTTGTVGDAVAHGLPALASTWPFLKEALGDAAIVYGDDEDGLVAAIDALDDDRLSAAAQASAGLRPAYASRTIGLRLLSVLEQVGTAKL